MKRTPVKRKPKRRLRGTSLEVYNRQQFVDAARSQERCAVTGDPGAFQAHHVAYEQELRRRHLPRYTTWNALRLSPAAHAAHHARQRVVKTSELTDNNIAYAFRALGAYAYDYLRRHYDDSEPDPRIEAGLAALS